MILFTFESHFDKNNAITYPPIMTVKYAKPAVIIFILVIRSELGISVLLFSSLFRSILNTKTDEVANGIMIIQTIIDRAFTTTVRDPPLYVIVSKIKTPAITVALIWRMSEGFNYMILFFSKVLKFYDNDMSPSVIWG